MERQHQAAVQYFKERLLIELLMKNVSTVTRTMPTH
jgi:hypothetical protein